MRDGDDIIFGFVCFGIIVMALLALGTVCEKISKGLSYKPGTELTCCYDITDCQKVIVIQDPFPKKLLVDYNGKRIQIERSNCYDTKLEQ